MIGNGLTVMGEPVLSTRWPRTSPSVTYIDDLLNIHTHFEVFVSDSRIKKNIGSISQKIVQECSY
jgi:hypothetical protein